MITSNSTVMTFFLKETRRQIESNDPRLGRLFVGQSAANYYPHDGDWGRDGRGIGENEHIKELLLSSDLGSLASLRQDDFRAFCDGIAGNSSIERLEMFCYDLFGGEIFRMLTPFFEQNSNLRRLWISGGGTRGIRRLSFRRPASLNNAQLLSASLSRFNTLKEFECKCCDLLDGEVEVLIRALAGHPGISRISFSGNEVGGRGAAEMSALLLTNPNSSLEWLNLSSCFLDDSGADILAAALGRNTMLKKLNLEGNRNISVIGWWAFAAALRNPNSALISVNLRGNLLDDVALSSFAYSLAHNNVLKELYLDRNEGNTTNRGWDAFSNALCNKTSINATFNSNHTLRRILQSANDSQLPSDVRILLQLNRENTTTEAARRKILDVHFSSGVFSMRPFIDMDLKVLPHAVAWMTRDEHGSSLLYKFVRNTTFLLNIGSGGTESEGEPKSKRQKVKA